MIPGILWNIIPTVHESPDDGILVELSWGWTAGMSEEELEQVAEDAPTGCESLVTGLDQIEDLIPRLVEIVQKYKEKHKTLTQEILKRIEEKMPSTEELLKFSQANKKPESHV